jgi:hypothetical protein
MFFRKHDMALSKEQINLIQELHVLLKSSFEAYQKIMGNDTVQRFNLKGDQFLAAVQSARGESVQGVVPLPSQTDASQKAAALNQATAAALDRKDAPDAVAAMVVLVRAVDQAISDSIHKMRVLATDKKFSDISSYVRGMKKAIELLPESMQDVIELFVA